MCLRGGVRRGSSGIHGLRGGRGFRGVVREPAFLRIPQLAAGCVRRARGANLAAETIAAHQITQREKHSREKQHQQEKTDDVPAFEHTLARSALSSRCHSCLSAPVPSPFPGGRDPAHPMYLSSLYLFRPPIDSTHLLMISIGSGKTIVVFFSTPISVSVCK